MSRRSRATSPSSATTTPARQSHLSQIQTSSTYSPTVTSTGGYQTKLNAVTRVAIEGKAKQGQDGASVKMYLKISLPLDSITPGATIPLFPEDNVKILTSQVHPIDYNSVPYYFSSTTSPMLHSAARALNLPARSQENFYSAFGLSQPYLTPSIDSSGQSSKSDQGEPIDVQFTGTIVVTGYNISYVLPKKFPSHHSRGSSPSGNETENFSSTRSAYRYRRGSIGGKSTVQFMAAIDMWVPYTSRPPRAPFLLSIPTPRCLHNHIKLKIFPPTNASSSFASLSSIEDDSNSWDLTSDPHVTRSASNRPSRSNSYTHFADDESSDSSTAGFADGCGLQGTFPSAERIRVRWAKPLKNVDVPGAAGDGRRRAGVKDVKGEITCTVRGKMKVPQRGDTEGVLLDVDYKGVCKGIWFPGVATLLGVDVSLEAKGSDVSWVDGYSSEWKVDGGLGYTGFDVGAPPTSGPISRASSFSSESPQLNAASSSNTLDQQGSRANSTTSISSLLHAPLPAQHVAEYSFEGSATTIASASSPGGTLSSISSLPTSTPNILQSSYLRPPGVPITLHINVNDLLPPSKNLFTFTISGTILVTPRIATGRISGSLTANSGFVNKADGPEPIILPRFTVLAADSESTSITVRNELSNLSTTVEVYNSSGDIYKDAQARKTVLQKGGFTRCEEDGGRIVLKSVDTNLDLNDYPAHSKNAPSDLPSRRPASRTSHRARSRERHYPMITSVETAVTILTRSDSTNPDVYAVRITLSTPKTSDSDWLEFGLAQPGLEANSKPPKVRIIGANVDGFPVKFETTALAKESTNVGTTNAIPFGQMSSKEWICWVKVNVGASGGRKLILDYVVGIESHTAKKPSKGKTVGTRQGTLMGVFLPSFSLPVGRLEVKVDEIRGYEVSLAQSNLDYQQSLPGGRILLHYALEEYFYPHIALHIRPCTLAKSTFTFWRYLLLACSIICFALLGVHHLGSEMKTLRQSIDSHPNPFSPVWGSDPAVTVTATIYTPMESRTRSFAAETISLSPTRMLVSEPGASATSESSVIYTTSSQTLHPAAQTAEIQSIYIPLQSILTEYALQPFKTLRSFSWSMRDGEAIHATLAKVVETMDVIWQVLRRAYHYPLNPP